MSDFFGIGGYKRPAEGYFSWQHIVFSVILMVLMIGLAVFLGLRERRREHSSKNRVMIVTAKVLIVTEAFKYTVLGIKAGIECDPDWWTIQLPLFLCSIQLFTIPLAAFAKGRLKDASLDFVMLFGVLGAVLGIFGAAQNYENYPVISFNNVISGLTHIIAGFASLYIMISGMGRLLLKNIYITFTILFGLCGLALTANALFDYNYMFLRRGDGTPYDILYNLVGGNSVLYPVGVIALFLLYIGAFYLVHELILRHRRTEIR